MGDACDCDGNALDAIGVCGGSCAADEDNDGICDDVDACVGILGCMWNLWWSRGYIRLWLF